MKAPPFRRWIHSGSRNERNEVFKQAGKVVASVSVAGTVRQIHPQNRRSMAAQVQQTALAISQELGFGHDD